MTTCVRGCMFLLMAALAASSGCSSNACSAIGLCAVEPDGSTTPSMVDGGATAAGDGPSGGKALGFTPSNLGALDTTSGSFGDLVMTGNCSFSHNDDRKARCGFDDMAGYRALDVTQADGSKILVFIARNIRIPGSSTAIGEGSGPIALVALDSIEISGTLTVAGDHGRAVGGGGPGNSLLMNEQGKGPGGGQPGDAGGGGAFCGKGGGGGGTAGGAGGNPFGTPALIPLVGGSAGGSTLSGSGGGALMLVAGNKVVVPTTGIVNAGGGGNGDGVLGRAGAGSGGSILIEAPTVLIAGKVAANGGGSGLSGFNATTEATVTKGATGSTAGEGGGGDAIDGKPGALGPDNRYIAGGGGGVGRIRINTASGSATISGSVSPTLTTPCATQGTLAK